MIDEKYIKHTVSAPNGTSRLLFICPEGLSGAATQTSYCIIQQNNKTAIYVGKQHDASGVWSPDSNSLAIPVLGKEGRQHLGIINVQNMEMRVSQEEFASLHLQSLQSNYVQFVTSSAEDAIYDNMDIADIPYLWRRALESFTWHDAGYTDAGLFAALDKTAVENVISLEVAKSEGSQQTQQTQAENSRNARGWTNFGTGSAQEYSTQYYYQEVFGKQFQNSSGCVSCLLVLVLLPAILVFFVVTFILSQAFLLVHTIINSLRGASQKRDPFVVRQIAAQQAHLCVMGILFIVMLPLLLLVRIIKYFTSPSGKR